MHLILVLPSLFALNPGDFLLWSGGHEKLVSELLVFSFGTGRKAGRGRRVFSAAGDRRNLVSDPDRRKHWMCWLFELHQTPPHYV